MFIADLRRHSTNWIYDELKRPCSDLDCLDITVFKRPDKEEAHVQTVYQRIIDGGTSRGEEFASITYPSDMGDITTGPAGVQQQQSLHL